MFSVGLAPGATELVPFNQSWRHLVQATRSAILCCAIRLLYAGKTILGLFGDALQAVAATREEALILTPAPAAAPRINGAKVFGVRPGHPFLFTIPATGRRPIKFAVDKRTPLLPPLAQSSR
jgi:hypothetical protein